MISISPKLLYKPFGEHDFPIMYLYGVLVLAETLITYHVFLS